MRRTVGFAASLVVCAVLAAAPRTSPIQTPTLTPLPSPAAPNSAQPQLSVSQKGVLLSWVERTGPLATLKFAERTTTGWATPVTVASGENWFVNWADVPSVLRLADGTLAAHWLQKNGGGAESYDVRLSYSKDNGRTWSASFLPHTDGTKTEHGFASLIQMPGSGLGLVWLDGRTMTPGTHGAHSDAMSLRFGAFDKAWKQTAELAVDDKVCECCPTAAAVTSEGVIAAFRNRSDTEVRDIAVARLVNGKWSEPVPVHADNWKIDACPVNGPALTAKGRNVAVAWFTMQQEQGQVYVAFSADAGRTFGAPVRLDDAGSLGRTSVAFLPDGDALATWIEYAAQKATFQARRVTKSGSRSAASTIAAVSVSRASGYPRMALHGTELVYAWIESVNGVSQVKTSAGAVPSR